MTNEGEVRGHLLLFRYVRHAWGMLLQRRTLILDPGCALRDDTEEWGMESALDPGFPEEPLED